MNNIVPILLAALLGFGAAYLLRGESSSQAGDTELVSALAELRAEVMQLREQMAQRPQLASTHPAYRTPGDGFAHGLRDPDDPPAPPPPPPPASTDLVPAEHVRRDRPESPLPARAEQDTDLLRLFTPRHEDEEAHKQTLRAWLFVGEKTFLRRFGPPDEVRWSDGAEIWVYDGLFEREPGIEINLRFRAGRFIGVY